MQSRMLSILMVPLLAAASCLGFAQNAQKAKGDAAGGSFQLKIFEGYDFPNQRVVASGSSAADLSFYYQRRGIGIISYLGAAKIKQFQGRPPGLSAGQIASWEHYVAGPSRGTYVIQSRAGRYYLVTLEKFENQGKAASYWLMSFTWEELKL